jgi:glycosyltransferase involved in cell wall biosynthesis
MGEAGRRRAVEEFGWDRVAEQTALLYRSLV